MRFFFHYNKPASQQRRKPTISLHYRGACHLVDNLKCFVPTEGRIRPNTSPKFVMIGDARDISITKGVAILT